MPLDWVEELVDLFTDDASCLTLRCESVPAEQFPFECAAKTLGDCVVPAITLFAHCPVACEVRRVDRCRDRFRRAIRDLNDARDHRFDHEQSSHC